MTQCAILAHPWFRAYVRRREKNLKNISLVSGVFPGKADSIILLGFECISNPQNLMKIVRAIFEKVEILIFFLCELPLILRIGQKQNYRVEMFGRGPYISNLYEIDQLV